MLDPVIKLAAPAPPDPGLLKDEAPPPPAPDPFEEPAVVPALLPPPFP